MLSKNLETRLKNIAKKILEAENKIKDFAELKNEIKVSLPEKIEYGDFTSNFLFLLAKKIGKNPLEIFKNYEKIIKRGLPYIDKVNFLNGYLNIYVNKKFLFSLYKDLLLKKYNFTKNQLGRKQKFIVEYVSANPTGPLHLGNSRGAVLGDLIVNILKLCGFRVTKEYYVNDRGKQIDLLLDTILYHLGRKEFRDDYYQGAYVKEIADKFKTWVDSLSISQFKKFVVNYILKEYIKKSLNKFGTRFDNYYFETDLYKKDLTEKILTLLRKRKLLEERDGALWLKLSLLGENKDEVLIKSDGEPTYFFSDVLYNYEKFFIRKFKYSLIIVSSDHHDHARRLKAVFSKVFKLKDKQFIFLIYQMVHLLKEDQILKMSKRKGTSVFLGDILEIVDPRALRFYFAKYTPENVIMLDVDLLKKESEENPIWYALYTYARFNSILEKAKKRFGVVNKNSLKTNLKKSFYFLSNREEYLVFLRYALRLQHLIFESFISLRPNLLFQYFLDLCQKLNSFYEKEKILKADDDTKNRIIFIVSIVNFLEFLFSLFNIKPQKKLYKVQNNN